MDGLVLEGSVASTYAINPAAPHILPAFITAPGDPDYFLIFSAVFLVFLLFCVGTLYFRLHALPEHLAHGNASKLQFEVVAVLALLALFTHNNWLWVAALLLALVPIPDLHAPLETMAGALSRIAGWRRAPPAPGVESVVATPGVPDAAPLPSAASATRDESPPRSPDQGASGTPEPGKS